MRTALPSTALPAKYWLALGLLLAGCLGKTTNNADADPDDSSSDDTGSSSDDTGSSSDDTGSSSDDTGSSSNDTTSSSVTTGGVTSVGGNSSTNASTTGGGLSIHPIPFADGWAPLAQNDVGVQGAFYTFGDEVSGGNSRIEVRDAGSPELFCAQGEAALVLSGPDGLPAYSTYWGAAVGFNLAQEPDAQFGGAYDARAKGVIGFSFRLEGENPLPRGGELRFNIKVFNDDNVYCVRVPASGDNRFLITDLRQSCWQSNPMRLPPDPSQLEALQWQYVTNITSSYPFDICITKLAAIVND